ncbi:MAG: IS66 family transposase [Bacteroidales bacterium]|nr:IS66 family transposase [Bacteroidales bacterium]
MMVSEQQLRDQLAALESENARLSATIVEMNASIVRYNALVEERNALIAAKTDEVKALETKVSQLSNRLDWLLKKVFGRMSEKKHLPLDPEVLRREPSLFPELMTDEEKAALETEVSAVESEITKTISVKVKAKPARKPLDTDSLPVETEDIYPEGTVDENGLLKAGYEEIGTEVTRRLERVPAKVYVVETIRHKVIEKALPVEERKVMIAHLPLVPIAKGIAGSSILTDITLSKYMYHLPFYRIIKQYGECGVNLSSSTVNEWYEHTVDRLSLIYYRLRRHVLQSEYIQVDESVVPIMDDENHKTKKGYLWCVRDAITGQLFFHNDGGSRSNITARRLLAGYRGYLQCDGYEAYDQFENDSNIVLLGCWAHARRKFVEAQNEDNRLASEGLVFIKKLYKVESDAGEQGLSAEQRQELRIKEAYPVLRTFEKWCDDTYAKVLPKSRIGRAVGYAFALIERLSQYVTDGRLNIDNNLIENAIRPLAIGRKNWLFCGNDAAADRAAIVYSLIACCKAAEVDPREWMEDVLRQIPYYQRDGRDLEELLPLAWKDSHTR